MWLSAADQKTIVRLAPLVSIDLVIWNAANQALLGLRKNEPAVGYYFVPGGRILKGERLRDSFARILKIETNLAGELSAARLLGVYEHFYANNYFDEPECGTHYVVLSYELMVSDVASLKKDAQHSKFVWWNVHDLLESEQVHEYSKVYFRQWAQASHDSQSRE
jgi:colanic acid biosynthesis protein WcaH